MSKLKKLFVMGLAVAALGLLVPSCVFEPDGDAFIRFSWKSSLADEIDFIAASYNDVEWYMGLDPTPGQNLVNYTGSTFLPDNLYTRSLKSNVNNGRYFYIEPGNYTAICGLLDDDGITPWADIIANYKITVVAGTTEVAGDDTFFELAFDVNAVLLAQSAVGAKLWNYGDDGNTAPKFNKRALTSTITATDEVIRGNKKLTVEYALVPRIAANQ